MSEDSSTPAPKKRVSRKRAAKKTVTREEEPPPSKEEAAPPCLLSVAVSDEIELRPGKNAPGEFPTHSLRPVFYNLSEVIIPDWNQALSGDEALEVSEKTGEPVVTLHSLRVLGKARGVVTTQTKFLGMHGGRYISETVLHVIGCKEPWTAIGEADETTLEYPYSQFPASISEARSEARALRKLLRIKTYADVEVGHQKDRESLEPPSGPEVPTNSIMVKATMAGWSESKFLEVLNEVTGQSYKKVPDSIGAEVVSKIQDRLNNVS